MPLMSRHESSQSLSIWAAAFLGSISSSEEGSASSWPVPRLTLFVVSNAVRVSSFSAGPVMSGPPSAPAPGTGIERRSWFCQSRARSRPTAAESWAPRRPRPLAPQAGRRPPARRSPDSRPGDGPRRRAPETGRSPRLLLARQDVGGNRFVGDPVPLGVPRALGQQVPRPRPHGGDLGNGLPHLDRQLRHQYGITRRFTWHKAVPLHGHHLHDQRVVALVLLAALETAHTLSFSGLGSHRLPTGAAWGSYHFFLV